ncbi:MAG: FAD-dependent thymidylate synthase, partial [Gammaproteobacteria bacterium]|nr:FAD-dependent thymidylate synthase [Gammaproteobacteria bacterium]
TEEETLDVFKRVTAMSIPVSESLHFVWGFTNLPIEWREQAVRKRQWGFWLTSMREFGMDDFVSEGRWAPPVEGAVPPDASQFLEDFMLKAEEAYNKLKELGAPQEIARKVIPLCATHNGTMFSNFRTLLDTLSSRSCWIAQVDLWGPVIQGMVEELRRIHPTLGLIVSPPCFKRYEEKYQGCKYKMINQNRLTGEDPYAPCPLYCWNEEGHDTLIPSTSIDLSDEISTHFSEEVGGEAGLRWQRIMEAAEVGESYIEQGYRLTSVWEKIWGRNPFTGKILE